jgi:hypothetical protein
VIKGDTSKGEPKYLAKSNVVSVTVTCGSLERAAGEGAGAPSATCKKPNNCQITGTHVLQVNPNANSSGNLAIVCMDAIREGGTNSTITYKDPITLTVSGYPTGHYSIRVEAQFNALVGSQLQLKYGTGVALWDNDRNVALLHCGVVGNFIYLCDVDGGPAGMISHLSVRAVDDSTPNAVPRAVSPTITIAWK